MLLRNTELLLQIWQRSKYEGTNQDTKHGHERGKSDFPRIIADQLKLFIIK